MESVPAVPIRPISRAPPRGNRSDAVASMVGLMKQTPQPHKVAARMPVTGEFATLRASSPKDASRQEIQSRPIGDSLCAIGPAKCRATNMMPLT